MSKGAPTIDYSNILGNKAEEIKKDEVIAKKYKISFLGDSILDVGYGPKFIKDFDKNYEIFIPNDNCRFAPYVLRCCFEYQDQLKGSDLIHFNCGLWDVCYIFPNETLNFTPIDIYLHYLRRIVGVLKTYSPKIIFSLTTPVRDENPYNNNETIGLYNKEVKKLMEELNIPVIDLYTPLIKDVKKYIREDDLIHLSADGIEVAYKLISDKIKKTLEK